MADDGTGGAMSAPLTLQPVAATDLQPGSRYLCFMRAVDSTAIRLTSGGWPETPWFVGVALLFDPQRPMMGGGSFTITDIGGLGVYALPEGDGVIQL